MYDPISIQREAAHCLSQKGNINISIFVRAGVNIIRWIWPVPLRLLRDVVWNQCGIRHRVRCLITAVFLTATGLIYVSHSIRVEGPVCSLLFCFHSLISNKNVKVPRFYYIWTHTDFTQHFFLQLSIVVLLIFKGITLNDLLTVEQNHIGLDVQLLSNHIYLFCNQYHCSVWRSFSSIIFTVALTDVFPYGGGCIIDNPETWCQFQATIKVGHLFNVSVSQCWRWFVEGFGVRTVRLPSICALSCKLSCL